MEPFRFLLYAVHKQTAAPREDSETDETTMIATLKSGDPHASAHADNYHGKDLSTKVTCPSLKSKGKGQSTKELKAVKAREPRSVAEITKPAILAKGRAMRVDKIHWHEEVFSEPEEKPFPLSENTHDFTCKTPSICAAAMTKK